MPLSWSFVRRYTGAVLFSLIMLGGGWAYLDQKYERRKEALDARESALRDRELTNAKAELSLSVSQEALHDQQRALTEEGRKLRDQGRAMEQRSSQLTTRERGLVVQETKVDRKSRMDRNIRLYTEQYAALDPDDGDACDTARKDKLAGAQSILRLIGSDAVALGDEQTQRYVSRELNKWFIVRRCQER